MERKYENVIFHIDVNSAYLSWEAVNRLSHGESLDLRSIPSVVGGDPISRHGIVLAKSIPAKAYGIKTGETLYSAFKKCPKLQVASPNFSLYTNCSNTMVNILKDYSPVIERYSVDECFLEYSKKEESLKDIIAKAYEIKDRIKRELGFTVNIGISTNKLLAKMASDFKKPDRVHTLFKEEIKEKMWPLPIEELFMVGRASFLKLKNLGINTIGDLANYDVSLLKSKFKSYGVTIWKYANGEENSKVKEKEEDIKGIGNSTTISFDVTDRKTAHMVLISLAETVAMRLRKENMRCSLVAVSIKNSDFLCYSMQRKLLNPTDSTYQIIKEGKDIFNKLWKGEPIRHLGVRVSALASSHCRQMSIFMEDEEKQRNLDKTIDSIREKYGDASIIRSVFLNSGINSKSGGTGGQDNYPIMNSML